MIRDRREKLIDRGEREDARAIGTRMVAFDWGLRDVGKGRWVKKKKKMNNCKRCTMDLDIFKLYSLFRSSILQSNDQLSSSLLIIT